MAAPLVGRRITIEGLASKPELNGTGGVAVSFDDAKGRYNVKLDSNGAVMALNALAYVFYAFAYARLDGPVLRTSEYRYRYLEHPSSSPLLATPHPRLSHHLCRKSRY